MGSQGPTLHDLGGQVLGVTHTDTGAVGEASLHQPVYEVQAMHPLLTSPGVPQRQLLRQGLHIIRLLHYLQNAHLLLQLTPTHCSCTSRSNINPDHITHVHKDILVLEKVPEAPSAYDAVSVRLGRDADLEGQGGLGVQLKAQQVLPCQAGQLQQNGRRQHTSRIGPPRQLHAAALRSPIQTM